MSHELILDIRLFFYSLVGIMLLGAVATGILALHTVISRKDSTFDHRDMVKYIMALWTVPSILFAKRFGLRKSGVRRTISRYGTGPFNYISIWLITTSSMLMLVLWAWWVSNTSGLILPPQIYAVLGITISLQALGICLYNINMAMHNMREELGCDTTT